MKWIKKKIDDFFQLLWEILIYEELYTRKRNGIGSTYEGADFFRNYSEDKE